MKGHLVHVIFFYFPEYYRSITNRITSQWSNNSYLSHFGTCKGMGTALFGAEFQVAIE